ncbi:MAG: hypothetical protein [Caudoviricetes sp.]|nr:MAG: hypothetical protein [Caudoviricetes sp.]
MLVNNLASKIIQALFPQAQAFFEIGSTSTMAEMAGTLGIDEKARSSYFAGIENRASARVFLNAGYAALTHAMKLLIITGNVLLYRDAGTKKMHSYSVRDYVVRRDGSGNVLMIILKERLALQDLPTKFRAERLAPDADPYEDVTLYTKIERSMNRRGRVIYTITQECESHPIGSPSTYPEMLCPYIPLTCDLITGEHYGRGHVEDHAGDLARLSELSEASLLYEIEMMKLVNVIDPASGIDPDDMANAEVGEYISGAAGKAGNGVVAHEGGSAQKLQQVQADIEVLMQSLSIAFMYTGNTRDAERVTAEEIRANVSEANQTLGGVYAVISEVLHMRLAHILSVEEEPDLLQLINAKGITLDVAVGISSLNRQAQVEKLQYVSNALQVVLPILQQSSPRFNPDLIIDAICAGYGVDREALSYTPQQLQEMQEQKDQAAAAQQQQNQAQQAQSNPALAQLNSDQLGLTS